MARTSRSATGKSKSRKVKEFLNDAKTWIKNHKLATTVIGVGTVALAAVSITFSVLNSDSSNIPNENENVNNPDVETITIENIQSEAEVFGIELFPISINKMTEFKTKIGEVLGLDAELSKSMNILNCANATTILGSNYTLIDVESTNAEGKKVINTITIDNAKFDNILTDDKTNNAISIDNAINNFATKIDDLNKNGKITVMEQGKSPLIAFKKNSLSTETIKTMNGESVYYTLMGQTNENPSIFGENFKTQYLIDEELGKVYMLGLEYNEDGSEKDVSEYQAYSVALKEGNNPVEIIKNSFEGAQSFESTTVQKSIFDEKEGKLGSVNMALLGHQVTLTIDEAKELGLVDDNGNIVGINDYQNTINQENPVA